ncbi:glycosyltransferase [Ruminococcus sp.]|uniref:glycosyltransferase n=1 Tax=Ruminococcus sp. TaxID=41978 RepID=UPI002585F945|nr:glycosyltransferase [Ruminococcus sp.]MCR5021829.1 glycosyltransferase [Ruminococcus sp.]
MKILEINSTNFGSTGNIMLQIATIARRKGHTVITCCPASRDNKKKSVENQLLIGSRFSRNVHLKLFEYTGLNGCFSLISTISFLHKLDRFKPDLIHLHNLHNSYINLPMLFKYIKKNKIKVIWTLHDCWAFTGQCPHFTVAKCDKWRTGCYDCPQINTYPASKVDRTKTMWKLKRKWFTGVEDLTIVTPSKWLADLVRQSFLKEYPVKVINNGIDLNVFKPTASNFRQRHHIEDKFVLLGVAFGWGHRKGLDVFIELAKRLDESFQIVLVGTNDETDKLLPKNVISIHRTNNQKELAEIYTAADLFVNPTREEVLGLVNIEALACGTSVITFRTGGSPECIDNSCGIVVEPDNIDEIIDKINNIFIHRPFSKENCLNRALLFSNKEKYDEYVNLYEGK